MLSGHVPVSYDIGALVNVNVNVLPLVEQAYSALLPAVENRQIIALEVSGRCHIDFGIAQCGASVVLIHHLYH